MIMLPMLRKDQLPIGTIDFDLSLFTAKTNKKYRIYQDHLKLKMQNRDESNQNAKTTRHCSKIDNTYTPGGTVVKDAPAKCMTRGYRANGTWSSVASLQKGFSVKQQNSWQKYLGCFNQSEIDKKFEWKIGGDKNGFCFWKRLIISARTLKKQKLIQNLNQTGIMHQILKYGTRRWARKPEEGSHSEVFLSF